MMKKQILFVLFVGLLASGFAQKKTYAEISSKENATFIATQMSLKPDKTKFLEETLFKKYTSVSEEIKGIPNASKEKKQAVYTESYKTLISDLSQEFSKEEITRIKKLLKEQNKKRKKG